MGDESEGDGNIYRLRLLLTWQYVNFSKSLNREGIIYPSVLSKHSFVLIRCDVEKQSETCHSVVKVINNVGFALLCLTCAIQSCLLFALGTRVKGFEGGFTPKWLIFVCEINF